jgi:hypothetical protein
MKKFLIFTVIFILVFMWLWFFWYRSKPFIDCPKWYNKVINNFLWKYVSCKDQNWKTSWISYEKSDRWYLQLFTYDNDEIIKIEYYTSTNWYLYEECYWENWLRKCTTFDKWKFKFLMGIKNFIRWFWGRYDTWTILSIINYNEHHTYQWPYYLYYENWNIWLSWNYDKWLKTWLRIKYDRNWSILSEEYY